MKKYLLSILSVFIYTSVTYAQISEGGTPPSFDYPVGLRSLMAPYSVNTSSINVKELLYQDSIAERNGSPMRIATVIPVGIDINNNGEWITLPNKQRIWQQHISLPGANSLILGYKDFYIPEGGKLFVYNKNKSQVIGAYTENTNPGGGRFSNQIIYGDEIILEYVESPTAIEQARIVIEDVGYVYRDIYEEQYDTNLRSYVVTPGKSASCMIDVNCSEGDNWRDQQRGVVHIASKLNTAWYMCSGSLVNNTNNDETPYVLTATHCFYIYSGSTFAGVSDFATAQFYFNYEYSGCKSGSIVSTSQSIVGSTYKVNTDLFGQSDGLLLELSYKVPKTYNPYFNGWDISNTISSSGVVIHHPNGDVKKISTYAAPISQTTYTGGSLQNFWKVVYAATANGHGVSQVGSSGSPLFNSNGLIIGTLTGGDSYCTELTKPDYFGNIHYHWDKYAGREMKPFLDPKNSAVTSLAGYDPNKGVGIESERDNPLAINLALFPNPAFEDLNVNANGIIKQINVYSLVGQLIYADKDLNSSTAQLSVVTWPKGVYTVIVDTEEGRFSGKVSVK